MTYGQNMSISSFNKDETDQTANLSPTMRIDSNGEKCALIKILTTQQGFSFDVGLLGVSHTEWQNSSHSAEIWLYVPNGVKKISIQHPTLGSIKDHDLKMSLERGRTYIMELTTDQINTLVVDYQNSQDLEINVTPHDAEFYINGLKQNLNSNGHLTLTLPFGTHNYRVTADKYHPEESQITINNKEQRQTLTVNLKKAFGYLNVYSSPDFVGAKVYIDDNNIGEIPVARFPLKSGAHQLTIHHKLFLPYKETIVMTDSATVDITPTFKPNYAEYEIFVDGDKDAQIYDNGEYLSTGHWKGRLEGGEHIIEASKQYHTTISEKINVIKDTPRKVSLSRPLPTYGTLEITTRPNKAEVYIDNNPKPIGITDFINNHIQAGPHHIKIVLPGHKTEELDVEITEETPKRVDMTLTNFCNATIFSSPIAHIKINGTDAGETPFHVDRVAGDYEVSLFANGYSTYSKKMRLDGNTENIHIKLLRNYIYSNELYVQAGYNAIGVTGPCIGLGKYDHNFNIEGDFILGLSESEKIYWNDKTGETMPFATTYKPTAFAVKAGYGLKITNRIRLTPQLGGRLVGLIEKAVDNAPQLTSKSDSSVANWACAVGLSAGLRCNFAIVNHLGLSVTPEYLIGIHQSNGFKVLSDVSPKIKGMAEGFNCNVSLNIFF